MPSPVRRSAIPCSDANVRSFARTGTSCTLKSIIFKFDFVYLDPPYDANFHEFVIYQIFNCNFLKKDSIVICEHSPNLNINRGTLWETVDVRDYGQSRLTFLINVQHS